MAITTYVFTFGRIPFLCIKLNFLVCKVEKSCHHLWMINDDGVVVVVVIVMLMVPHLWNVLDCWAPENSQETGI